MARLARLSAIVVLAGVWAADSTRTARVSAQGVLAPAQATHTTQEPQPIAAGVGKAISGESEIVDPSNNPARPFVVPRTAPADLERAASGWPVDAPAPAGGLVISATFDSSITSNPSSSAIRAMINQAIAVCQSQFTDPITVSILFRYSTTNPDGSAISSGSLARSSYALYTPTWTAYTNALRSDATTSNDRTAIATLPSGALSSSMTLSSANGRAVGLNTPPAMFADGHVGTGGPYDGIVTLNSNKAWQFTRPVTSAQFYDAQRSTEHEIDEVLGFGSLLDSSSSDYRPQDLFSWSGSGTRSISTSGTRYFSIDGGQTNIVNFNQDSSGDRGDWFSPACPQSDPYVQNAFSCAGQQSDVTPGSPEGINLDVIGYDLSGSSSVPPAPTNLVGLVSRQTVTLTWTAASGATSYQIEAGSSSGLANLTSFNTGNTSTSFSTSGVAAGTYYVRVRGVNSAGTGLASNEVLLTVASTCSAPDAPSGLTSSVSGSTVSLSWTAGARATSYVLQAGSTSGASNLAAVDVGNTTSYVANGVGNGTYFVRVVTKNSCGTSAASNEVVVTVNRTTTTTSSIHFSGTVDVDKYVSHTFTATQTGRMTATLSWASVSDDLDLYLTSSSCIGDPLFDCTLLAASQAESGNSEQVTYSVTNGSSYKVWADNFSARAVSYSIDITFTPTTTSTPLQFTAPTQLNGTVGVPFFYSFCKPDLPDNNAALCDSSATNPTGGQPPYHFQLGSGVGFPPLGLSLQLNGILRGTPTVAGTSTFVVQAVDLAGTSSGTGLPSGGRVVAPASVSRTIQMTIANATTTSGVSGQYSGTFSAPALSAVCIAQSGTWSATVTANGNALTVAWFDSYHKSTSNASATLSGNTTAFSVYSGDDRVDFTATFGTNSLSGTFVGPLCTVAADRYRGTFTGQKQ